MISVRRNGMREESDWLVEPPRLLQQVNAIGEESASGLAKIKAALDSSLSAGMVSRAALCDQHLSGQRYFNRGCPARKIG